MFLDVWNNFYPNCVPLPWITRDVYSDIWFRIYSLPKGKRYAETSQERKIIATRHNIIAKEVLGEGSLCWVAWNCDKKAGNFIGHKVCDYEDEWTDTTVYATQTIWKSNSHDDFILKVADDELSSSIFLNSQSGDIYAPYDGGADIFIRDSNKKIELERKLIKWLSPLESGL